ncbi:hypothetical protein P175DRAFT_0502574 [Aspergillus ochraceoroseus IBT 24754]|uniref:Acid phosphatase n=3 Tax=Aspergillus subgen. Nidulantes TaxID=2720870 RepID=A0A0F8UL92_9EURO|nr:uncharacterized protein P175DRAFT_0502574 [Aspergillus ochraceoroseus IBT 24754]KKK20303.1 hypothetical protein ARAM_002439 [Aspergillus rambellii]KKK24819.1 hypothetical protein AOCH_000274 [Aspergillus ochraceoroseus]PTU20454.1 hypothetical protein P175DRAFT_0502574 [Aspergillus ochraceoroseus IBT 24754]
MKLSMSLVLAGLSLTAAMPFESRSSHKTKVKGKWFERFVVIVLENTNKDVTFGDPYFLNLTNMGMVLGGYHGTTHPSQPNYITMVSNTIAGGVFTDADANTTQASVIDLFEPAGITWKAYMEGYSPLDNGDCNPYSEDKTTLYVRKHNPFMSFDNIRNNLTRCQNIVNAEENFAKDVALGADAPNYMFYTPNLKNDAHDTNISYAAKDVQYLVDTMLLNKEFMKDTLILITFDENMIYLNPNFGQPNSIYTLVLGNDTVKCYDCVDQQYYNHFSQVVTLERNWNLTTLPQPDGSEEGWDQWMRPFGMLRSRHDDVCAYAPCDEYYDGKSPKAADGNWGDQDY